VRLDGAWRRARGVLIDTDVGHAFDCAGQLTAIGWIEGESRLAAQLRDRVLDGRPYALLSEPLCGRLADGLGPAAGTAAGCPEAYQRWRDALGCLAVDVTPEPGYDDRIAAVLDHLRATPSPPPSVEDLMQIAHLSQSRLQHLFRDQVGVPIRRYLLWHRYLTALSLLADGASVTRAAHAAGFADSAHLTRTAVRMNGFTPTKMPFGMWLTNCR
jgi:AraC-like DNA-binding protein